MTLRIVVYWLAALLVGAHFLRTGGWVLALACAAVPLAFFSRRRFVLVLLQALAYGAAGMWIYTAWQLVQARQALGQNWALATAILGAVALYSLLAGLLLNTRAMRERYPG